MAGRTHNLYRSLRTAILEGTLKTGRRMPSSRDLGRERGFSRTTIVHVYESLAAEGLIRMERGRGSFVSYEKPDKRPTSGKARIGISDWGRRAVATAGPDARQSFFWGTEIDADLFPEKDWRASVHRALRQQNAPSHGRSAEAGVWDLRSAVASHLRVRRGILSDPEDVVITNGSIQAIALIAQMWAGRGRNVVVENPSYAGTRRAVLTTGARLISADVDERGVVPGNWNAHLAFLTPNQQFPTGTVLSPDRRRTIVDWAQEKNAILVEDDFDSEFHRSFEPIEPLRALSAARVIYVGSFTRTMFPRLRLGFAVLPHPLRETFLRAKSVFESESPGWLEQKALADFMERGSYVRHLKRAGREYARRHRAMVQAFEEHLPGCFVFTPSQAGLHLFAKWTGSRRAFQMFHTACSEAGFGFRAGDSYFLKGPVAAGLFAFGHLAPEKIQDTVRRMGEFV